MNSEGSKKLDSRSNPAPVRPAGFSPVSGATADPIHAAAAPRPRGPAAGPFAGAWWPTPSPGISDWGFPLGGFVNYLQQPNGSNMAENFVGGSMSHSSMSPKTPCSEGTPSPTVPSAAENARMGSQGKGNTITIDDEDSPQHARDRRLNWSHEEDIRLVSAWLQNSVDPIDGNDKKAEQYWADVTCTYNSTTDSKRLRNWNQLKLRWERIKKPVNEFNGCYTRITKVHQSGMSDDQQMDQARQLYASEHEDKPFAMEHVWKILRHEKKWSAHVMKNYKEKDKGAGSNSAHAMNIDDYPKNRLIGCKKAKDERSGKRKAAEAISTIGEKLDKFLEASTKAEKMAEVQHTLADKKIEGANLSHKAAQEQTKSKMIDLYKELLFAPTADLSEGALAERTKALESMRLALFDKKN